ncbi:MAG: SDR family oxidoreductase, partial [Acidobacteria bacterium]|nr:SDR family oxidoreductase [Acidobacteriota bacterium]
MSTSPEYVEGHDLLRDKRVVVTAAAGTGIGFSVAKRCIEEGATVLISDLHERRLAEASAALSEVAGHQVASVMCNVTNEDQVQNLISTGITELGSIDVLINNAGLGGQENLVDMVDEQWMSVIDVTLNGTMRCTRAVLEHMYSRGSGVIINNASVVGWRAQAGQAHYAAAKAGVMGLTRCVAIEAAEHGVRVNAVAPSLAMHPFLVKVSDQDFLDELASREPFGRAAEVWEVANVM